MAKLEARYVPIGTKLEETKVDNGGKTLKQLEEEAKLSKQTTKSNKPEVKKLTGTLKPLGQNTESAETEKSKSTTPEIKPLTAIKSEPIQPLEPKPNVEPEVEPEQELDLFEDDFLNELTELEEVVKVGIQTGAIKLIVTNADQNMNNIKDVFDQAIQPIAEQVNYDIRDEKKVVYSQVIAQVANKLEKLEQTIDHESYQNELRLTEFEDGKLRENRYRKRKLDGLDEVGGIEGKDHRTAEKNIEIDLKKNTDFSSDSGSTVRKSNEQVERRAFVQDYEGSDLEGIDKERDRLEAEILKKQEAEDKANKKKSKKKTEEEKIAEAKERLRKKQEKRKNKQKKKEADDVAAEIDLVGNQFDVDEMREEKMDRLLEIKRLSAEKKELQKQKEKQRSKATKEFYKYKKVNKKSHIVGFKQ